MKKRIFSLFMTFMMCLSVLPVGAAAAAKYPITGRTTKEMSIYKAAKVNKNIVLKKLPRNSKVKIVKKFNSDFYQVEYGKYKGYIQRKYTLEVRPFVSTSKEHSQGVIIRTGVVYAERVKEESGKSTKIQTLAEGTPITLYHTESTSQGKAITPISYTLGNNRVGYGFLLSTVESADGIWFQNAYKAKKEMKLFYGKDPKICITTKNTDVYNTKKVKKKEVINKKIKTIKKGTLIGNTGKKIKGDYVQISIKSKNIGYVKAGNLTNHIKIKANTKVFNLFGVGDGWYMVAMKQGDMYKLMYVKLSEMEKVK